MRQRSPAPPSSTLHPSRPHPSPLLTPPPTPSLPPLPSLVLESAVERVYSPDRGVEEVTLGHHVVRGDTVAVVGLLNEAADAALDRSAVRADPLKPVAW